jgi:hypothetical protein
VTPPVNPNPGFSMTDKPQAVILAMDTERYFNLMTKLRLRVVAPPDPLLRETTETRDGWI